MDLSSCLFGNPLCWRKLALIWTRLKIKFKKTNRNSAFSVKNSFILFVICFHWECSIKFSRIFYCWVWFCVCWFCCVDCCCCCCCWGGGRGFGILFNSSWISFFSSYVRHSSYRPRIVFEISCIFSMFTLISANHDFTSFCWMTLSYQNFLGEKKKRKINQNSSFATSTIAESARSVLWYEIGSMPGPDSWHYKVKIEIVHLPCKLQASNGDHVGWIE